MKLLSRVKDRLETPETGAATLVARLIDLAVVTYAVPAEAARPLLPPGLAPDALPGEDGAPLAFLQTVCCYVQDSRWAATPAGSGDSFHQVSHRVLTRRAGRRGAYVLRTDLSTGQAHVAQRVIARDADWGRFSVHIAGDPVRGTYQGYSVHVSGERGKTELSLKPLPAPAEGEGYPAPFPFGRFADMADFFSDREELYFAGSTPRTTVLTPVKNGEPSGKITAAGVSSARLTIWSELGLVPAERQDAPVSALLIPSRTLTSYPPRPVKLAEAPKRSPEAVGGAEGDGGTTAD